MTEEEKGSGDIKLSIITPDNQAVPTAHPKTLLKINKANAR